MIYRLRKDYKIEVNILNKGWRQLRVCHLHSSKKSVKCGVYCCSPIDSGYNVLFTELKIKEDFF